MRKLCLVFMLTVTFGLFSCQSHQTKNKLVGTWVYAGGSVASVTFTSNNTFYTGGILNSNGRYEIDGKDITIYYSHGGSSNLRIADDGCLYVGDGSRYVKISDDVNFKQESINYDALYEAQRTNQALNYLKDYNTRMGWNYPGFLHY